MSERVLYFPYIRVPESAWFTRVLLYWDSVGSIVPSEFMYRPERLGPHMQALVAEGLVKQIIPAEHLYDVPNFSEPFLQLAESHRRKMNIGFGSLSELKTSRVHAEKLDMIARPLCEMGLASEADYPWFNIEATIADQFMAYLAGVLGALPSVSSIPITDQQGQLRNYETVESNRNIILEHLLPAPADEIDVSSLASFKSNHHRELVAFRNEVELFLLDVASIAEDALRQQKVARFVMKAESEINNIIEDMKSHGWSKITMGRFIAYVVAGLTLVDAIATGGLVSTIAAAFGATGAAYSTYQESRTPDSLKNSYFAYAALATKLPAEGNDA